MKALRITKHGPVAELAMSDVDEPRPSGDGVKVRIEAAGINPSDLLSAKGGFPEARLPRILGRDFAGEVVEGPPELLGAKVWGTGGDLGITRDGTHAASVVLPAKAVAFAPKNVSIEQAGSMALPFLTALMALERARLNLGETVAITGAAGAVGSCAAQLARAKGASVIAIIKDESQAKDLRKEDFLAIVRSDSDDIPATIKRATRGRGCDVALNAIGAPLLKPLLESVAEHGRVVVFSASAGREGAIDMLPFYRRELELLGINTVLMDAVACGEVLKRLTPLFESAALRPLGVAERLPLARAPEGYARVETGIAGKIVLVP
ncbi:MAG TPA: zinc-binding alcohol dehydrogenase family protein [Planctomycetota bacterium]|nr:zinc-binding alcohol dehydrogenase family protein [Planctomycetota bacterium]